MNKNKSIILKHAHIEGIWGKYTIDFFLDSDVNILIGNNGVGKTTLLNILAQVCLNDYDGNICNTYQTAELQFSENYKVIVSRNESNKKNATWYHEDIEVNYEDVKVFIDIVSTFDTSYPKDFATKIKTAHEDAESELDLVLYRHIDLLYKYMNMISNQSRQLHQIGEDEMAEQLYFQYDKMQDYCNRLFENKTWYQDEDGTIKFKMKEDNDIVGVTRLSSGEKQMLIMLISTLTQNGKKFITFWDEPEISLHIAWQQVLIPIMRELNPNMQIIMATHSPSILDDGWEMRPIDINSIKTRE